MHIHGHSGHPHTRQPVNMLWWAVGLTAVFALVEAVGGWLASSLALLGDAGHMLTDTTALALAALASWVARQPPSRRHSYGLVRAEVVAALINGLFMIAVVFGIAYHAIQRLMEPVPVAGLTVMVIAALGLIVNIAVVMILHRGDQTLNTRAALLHVIGDILGSVAALLAGVVIYFTAWMPIDPLLSLLICVLILYSTYRLLREALHVIMEGVPPNIELPEVGDAMAQVDGVSSIHDLHIWTLSTGLVALSAHVVVRDMVQWREVLTALQQLLHDSYGIEHVTLQPESDSQPLRQMQIKTE